MRETVFRDLHNLFPDRIVNVTNGIAFRRWLHEANPRLTRLLVKFGRARSAGQRERPGKAAAIGQ